MRPGAGLQADETGIGALEEGQNPAAVKLALQGRRTVRVDAVHLKHGLGRIEADGGRMFRVWRLSSGTSRCAP
jgi:hypothetical protein